MCGVVPFLAATGAITAYHLGRRNSAGVNTGVNTSFDAQASEERRLNIQKLRDDRLAAQRQAAISRMETKRINRNTNISRQQELARNYSILQNVQGTRTTLGSVL